MTGFWLVSFIVLWIVVISLALIIFMMAREIEVLHTRLDSYKHFYKSLDGNERDNNQSMIQLEERDPIEFGN